MAAPTISVSSVIPGTTIPANTGRVSVTWRASSTPPNAATSVLMGGGAPGAEVLPDNARTDWGVGVSDIFPTVNGSYTTTINRTHSIDIYASNDDGGTDEREIFYAKIPVSYHDAAIPGAPAFESELATVRGYLEVIEGRLNDNVLATLPDYLETYNSRVPEEYRFPEFGDIGYLSGRVGTGSLADDILNAMHDVLIYIKPHTMPRGYRPGTITVPDNRALCAEIIRDGDVVGQIYGKSTREWVSICLDSGADDLTLLHELFHHASTSNNESEARAFAVSMCAYNILP